MPAQNGKDIFKKNKCFWKVTKKALIGQNLKGKSVLPAQVQTWAQQQGQKIQGSLAALEEEREEIQRLLDWISSAGESLTIRDQEPLAESTEQIQEVIEQHLVRLFLHVTHFIYLTFNRTPGTVYKFAFVAFVLRKPAKRGVHALSDGWRCGFTL